MVIPDKQIHNNFTKFESIFLRYSRTVKTFTEVIPYQAIKNWKYRAYYIVDGAMELKITGAEGGEKITAVVKHGSFYTQFSDTKVIGAYNSFISVPSPKVRILLFTKEEFELMMRNHPDLALELLYFYEDLTISLQCELKDILFFDGKKRLCDHLYACSHAGTQLTIVMTQEEIGKYIGLDRTNVSKYLQELKAEGIIEIGRNRITILDIQAIHRFAIR